MADLATGDHTRDENRYEGGDKDGGSRGERSLCVLNVYNDRH